MTGLVTGHHGIGRKNQAVTPGSAQAATPSIRWRYGRGLTCVVALLVALAGAPVNDARSAPAPVVTVETVSVQDVAPVYTYVGHVEAIQSVQVMARITAFLVKIAFTEGGDVKAGQTLFELENAPFAAAEQAAQAQLDKAQAAYRQADTEYQRQARLNQQGFAPQAILDQARATRDSDAADVEAAKANLATAAINLSYTKIVSPTDGRIGKALFSVGSLLTPASAALATVEQMEPIRVVFAVPDRDVVSAEQQAGTTPEKIAAQLSLDLRLSNGTKYGHSGRIELINNQVDQTTGTVTVWGRFDNPEQLLLPGAFVTVDLHTAQPEHRPMVPVAAVQQDKQGAFVLVVGPDNGVKEQRVTLGRQVGQYFVVADGLSGGEHVIVEGIQKVQPGQTVNPLPRSATASPGQAG
jgi:membrane fusion protein (multidrug efflux system)